MTAIWFIQLVIGYVLKTYNDNEDNKWEKLGWFLLCACAFEALLAFTYFLWRHFP